MTGALSRFQRPFRDLPIATPEALRDGVRVRSVAGIQRAEEGRAVAAQASVEPGLQAEIERAARAERGAPVFVRSHGDRAS
jgi:hypothetical protein